MLIREAGSNGARVIGFPEGFIPAHTIWFHFHSGTDATATRLSTELFKNSVEIPGREVEALAAAARDAGAYVVMGVCERELETVRRAASPSHENRKGHETTRATTT